MTDTTDIKALREIAKKINHRLDVVMGALSPFNPDESAHWDCEKLICDLISQLEAERQRADDAESKLRSEVMKNLLTTDCMRKAHRKIAEMESEQVPVAYYANGVCYNTERAAIEAAGGIVKDGD